jgi:hypothetical protein
MRLPSRSGFHYPNRPNVLTEEQWLARSIYDEKDATLAKLQWAIAVLEYRAFRFDEAKARVARKAVHCISMRRVLLTTNTTYAIRVCRGICNRSCRDCLCSTHLLTSNFID